MFTYTYTDANNVAHSIAFTYDADGLMAKQVVDGVETRFVYSPPLVGGAGGGGLCLQERNSSNEVTRSYAWDPTAPGGIGGLLELTANGQHYDYLYDGKGNVGALIDANQQVVAKYRYAPFGELVGKSGTLDQPYQFSTKYYYPGFGGSDYGYRFYLASLGRWATRDPLGEAGGLNLYGAMHNSPMNYIDPLGLFTEVLFVEPSKGRDLGALGHVAVNINGTVYSFATDGMAELGSYNFVEYYTQEEDRSIVGLVLDITTEEEKILERDVKDFSGRTYTGITNCGDPVESGLEDLGYDLGINNLPSGLRESIEKSGIKYDYTYYPKRSEP